MSYNAMVEENPFDVRLLDPKKVRLFRTDSTDTKVRLTLEGERSWIDVRIARAFPFSDPDHYIGMRDGDDKDIGLLIDLRDVGSCSRRIVEEELARRYFTPKVKRVIDVREQFQVSSWEVETDHGIHKFVVRNLRDNSYPIGHNRLMMVDTDGNRYEFPDTTAVGPLAAPVLAKVI
jgi:hypothetical protein